MNDNEVPIFVRVKNEVAAGFGAALRSVQAFASKAGGILSKISFSPKGITVIGAALGIGIRAIRQWSTEISKNVNGVYDEITVKSAQSLTRMGKGWENFVQEYKATAVRWTTAALEAIGIVKEAQDGMGSVTAEDVAAGKKAGEEEQAARDKVRAAREAAMSLEDQLEARKAALKLAETEQAKLEALGGHFKERNELEVKELEIKQQILAITEKLAKASEDEAKAAKEADEARQKALGEAQDFSLDKRKHGARNDPREQVRILEEEMSQTRPGTPQEEERRKFRIQQEIDTIREEQVKSVDDELNDWMEEEKRKREKTWREQAGAAAKNVRKSTASNVKSLTGQAEKLQDEAKKSFERYEVMREQALDPEARKEAEDEEKQKEKAERKFQSLLSKGRRGITSKSIRLAMKAEDLRKSAEDKDKLAKELEAKAMQAQIDAEAHLEKIESKLNELLSGS